jgi:hypothetical protein
VFGTYTIYAEVNFRAPRGRPGKNLAKTVNFQAHWPSEACTRTPGKSSGGTMKYFCVYIGGYTSCWYTQTALKSTNYIVSVNRAADHTRAHHGASKPMLFLFDLPSQLGALRFDFVHALIGHMPRSPKTLILRSQPRKSSILGGRQPLRPPEIDDFRDRPLQI